MSSLMMTDQDFHRLTALLDRVMDSSVSHPESLEFLEEELGRADVVPQTEIPSDIVTMNSIVRFVDTKTEEETQVTLVYPSDADYSQGKISVLAPLGAALIGLRVGQKIEWPLPNGEKKCLQVLSVVYQPEASGDWNL